MDISLTSIVSSKQLLECQLPVHLLQITRKTHGMIQTQTMVGYWISTKHWILTQRYAQFIERTTLGASTSDILL